MNALIDLAWTQFWQLTLLIVLVGALAHVLGRRAPATVATLWLVVMLKALVPPLWSSPTGLFSWAQAGSQPAVASLSEQSSGVWIDPAIAEALMLAAAVVWAVGVFVLLGVAAARGVVLRRTLACERLPSDHPIVDRANAIAAETRRRGRVEVAASTSGWGPAVCGLWRTTIVLPKQLVEESDFTVLRPLILHELLHSRRGDTLFAFVQTLAKAVWWFHPMVWWAGRQADRVVERCVDRGVVACLKGKPAEYARGMLRVLELKTPESGPTALVGLCSAPLTEERLNEVFAAANHRRKPAGSALRHGLTLAAAAAIVLPGYRFDGLDGAPCKPPALCEAVEADAFAERLNDPTPPEQREGDC